MLEDPRAAAKLWRCLSWCSLLAVPFFGVAAFGCYQKAEEFDAKAAAVAAWPEVPARVLELDIEEIKTGGGGGDADSQSRTRRVGYVRTGRGRTRGGRAGKAGLLLLLVAANSDSGGSKVRIAHRPIVRLAYEAGGETRVAAQPYLAEFEQSESAADAEMQLAVFGGGDPLTVRVNPEDPSEAYAFAKRPPLTGDMDRRMMEVFAVLAVLAVFSYAAFDWAGDRAMAGASLERTTTTESPTTDGANPYADLSSARLVNV